MARRKFGRVRKLPSGKFQAAYTGPNGLVYKAEHTFNERYEAEAWLGKQENLIRAEVWVNPEIAKAKEQASELTVGELVEEWLASANMTPETKQTHLRKLNARVLCDSIPGKFDSLKNERVVDVTQERIELWDKQVYGVWPNPDRPAGLSSAQRSNSYANATALKRLHTAFEYAVSKKYIAVNPAKIKDGTAVPKPKTKKRRLISLDEAKLIAEHMVEEQRVGVQILFWAGLRVGELLELRRKDLIGLDGKGPIVLQIRRNASQIKCPETGKQIMVIKHEPKTEAGNRDIALPQTISDNLRLHAKHFMAEGPEALVITDTRGRQSTRNGFQAKYKRAAKKAGRGDTSPHDCRRFFCTRLVSPTKDKDGKIIIGAPSTLEEARILTGHETVEQLLEYQRAESGYRERVASELDKLLS